MHICGNTLNTFGLYNTSKQIYYFMIYIWICCPIVYYDKWNYAFKQRKFNYKKYVKEICIKSINWNIFIWNFLFIIRVNLWWLEFESEFYERSIHKNYFWKHMGTHVVSIFNIWIILNNSYITDIIKKHEQKRV